MNCNCEDIYPCKDVERWESCPASIIADADNYYTKHQVDELIESASGCCITPEEVDEKIEEAVSGKQDTLIAGSGITISGNVISADGADLSNYYTKSETSGKTEIANALNSLDNKKLDASAYTPTDLSNYYTKSETSGKTELSTAFNNKQDKLIAGANITISGNVISAAGGSEPIIIDPTLSSGSSNPVANSAITNALDDKLDITAYTPTDLTNYYTKTESDGRYQPKGEYATEEWVEDNYYSTAYTYTKTQVDSLILNLQNQISALTEAMSECCSGTPTPTVEYQWITVVGEYICDGNDKYTKQRKLQSTDGGQTWSGVIPEEYRKGTLIEASSSDCGAPTGDTKLYMSGGSYNRSVTCIPEFGDSTNLQGQLTKLDTEAARNAGTAATVVHAGSLPTVAIVGDCVELVNSGCFEDFRTLTRIDFGNGVKTMYSSVAAWCTSLTSITIGTSIETIGSGAFSNCSNLQSLTIMATTPPTITNDMLNFSDNALIYVPCESISAYKTAWSQYASRIQSCPFTGKWLATYTGGTTSSAACDSSSVIAQNEITNKANLESILIGDCVTSIDNAAFYDCADLTSVIIPSGVTSIGFRCFQNCSGLTSVTVEATTPPTLSQTNPFDNTNNCPIYVPAESVNAYKTANGWSQYSSRIQAIP